MAERRRADDDRRQAPGRRAADYQGRATPLTFLWAVIGALVVLYLFFVVAGGVDPADDPAWGIAALVLGILWLAHSWKRLLTGGASPAPDRERRGF
jgi:hypothetical protein